MSGASSVASLIAVSCVCPNRDCPRHGNCNACRDFHAKAKHPPLPYCERKRSWFRRLLVRNQLAR
jgi:hypothetical protein